MLVLAIDSGVDRAAAAVYDAAERRERGRSEEPMRTGQAERLMAVIAAALSEARVDYAGLDRIAVCTGPGSFTGLRVAVAAARGLALALGKPAVGVSVLEALASEALDGRTDGRPCLVAIEGGRDVVYAAAYAAGGAEASPPFAGGLDDALAVAERLRPVLAGTAAPALAERLAGLDLPLGSLAASADIVTVARLGAARQPGAKPTPLYLRPADAKPQAAPQIARRG